MNHSKTEQRLTIQNSDLSGFQIATVQASLSITLWNVVLNNWILRCRLSDPYSSFIQNGFNQGEA